MKDIQSKIQGKYGFDISRIQLLKLYKIDDADISSDELETKIADCRRKWNQSINGANEKYAQRDREHLERADAYEAVLRDRKLRKEVFAFYNKSNSDESSATEFAREYFSIVATTKKIKKSDVNFFFDYFQSERKNKKAVCNMLERDFKVIGLGKDSGNEDEKTLEEEDDGTKGKKKDETSPLVVNLFQKSTVLKLSKCEIFFQKAKESETLRQRYPALGESLYGLLEMDGTDSPDMLSGSVMRWRDDVFNQRQERGQEFAPLVDLFNTLYDVLDYQDVVDNFAEFKLLIKYSALTPYMYCFVDMKQSTLKELFVIANKYYYFKDINEFMVNYFIPVYDNFNISAHSVKSVIKKAQQKAEKKVNSNKILNMLFAKFGGASERKAPLTVSIIHWIVYWPVFMVYLVLEIAKYLCFGLRKAVIPLFGVLLVVKNIISFKNGEENLWILLKIFSRKEWYPVLEEVAGKQIDNGFTAVMMSLITIVLILVVYLIPFVFAAVLVRESLNGIVKQVDWIGIERTFKNIFITLKEKTLEQFRSQRKEFYKSRIFKAVMNVVCTAILVWSVCFVPTGLSYLSEITGYGQRMAQEQTAPAMKSESEKMSEDNSEGRLTDSLYVIAVEMANIRKGPGTEYSIVMTASRGQTFVGTGKEQKLGDEAIWYEIYLDDSSSQTGWVSHKVIEQ